MPQKTQAGKEGSGDSVTGLLGTGWVVVGGSLHCVFTEVVSPLALWCVYCMMEGWIEMMYSFMVCA